jgi:hypothetical protein
MVRCYRRQQPGHLNVTIFQQVVTHTAQVRLGRLLTGAMLALGLAGLPADPALALTLEETVERFERCGYQIGDQMTVYSVEGTPTTFYRVWTEDQHGTRGLVVYVYASQDAADDVFHILATVERLEGLDPTPDSGPLLERGVGRSVWRENVAVAQIVPLTDPTDLDAVPDDDLVRCLDTIP